MKISEKMDWFRLIIYLDADKSEEHSHSDIEMLYVLEGEIIVSVENLNYRMEKGDIILINAEKKHSLHRVVGGAKKNLICCIKIDRKTLSEYTGQYRMVFWCNTMKDSDQASYKEMRDVLDRILLDYANGDSKQQFYRYSLYYQLLHNLVTYHLASKDEIKTTHRDNKEDERYIEICNYIEMHSNEDVSLNELADEFHLSISYLSKYLKKKSGVNFTDYLYSVRMHNVVEELLNTQTPVTRLALDYGFPSIGAFNKQFKDAYHCTPSEYRSSMIKKQDKKVTSLKLNEDVIVNERLKEHFGVIQPKNQQQTSGDMVMIEAEADKGVSYQPIWNEAIDVSEAEMLLYSNVQDTLVYAHKVLRTKYVRFWSIFNDEMHISSNGSWNNNGFAKLNHMISFLLENQMKPIIELGEKPRRLLLTTNDYLQPSRNISNFKSYSEFLECLTALMHNFVSYFGKEEVESWGFELWEDRRIEVYSDKVPYIQLYKDVNKILKKDAPNVKLGASGNHLGWYKEHTEKSIRKWIDNGLYPDYLTYTYYPSYVTGDAEMDRFAKRKSDESDLAHTLDELNQLLLQYGFPEKKLYITEWNMTVSSRNYFNDSLWKGCYVLKCNLECIGKLDGLVYSQLSDSTTDYSDTQLLINGSGGLITRDMIEKPAFFAMKMLSMMKPKMISKGDGYAITMSESGEIIILMYNFINRNYLYFLKNENENMVQDHYQYFENQNEKKMLITIKGLPHKMRYSIREYIVNRENGSIMDEWMRLSCIQMPREEDVNYLRKRCTPKVVMSTEEAIKGKLELEYLLEPLEMRCVELKPQ